MENEIVEVGAQVAKGDLIKVGIAILGIGAIFGIGFGIKKLIDSKKSGKIVYLEQKENPENEPEEK